MLDIMDQAKSAIEAYNQELRTTSSNIANMSVIGYKRVGISFQEVFNRVLVTGSGASSNNEFGGTNPLQSGGTAGIASLGIDFSQGQQGDGTNLSLAIQGQGLFIVSPDDGTTKYYSRAGDFQRINGNLVTSTGMQVYGLDDGGNLVPITGLTGDKYNPNNLSFDANGRLVEYTDTTWTEPPKNVTGFRIALTYFNNPSGLEYVNGTSFKETLASGSPVSTLAPGAAAGTVAPRRLEQSNVFYIGETIDALNAQRAMSANLSIVSMVSNTISQFINKIGS